MIENQPKPPVHPGRTAPRWINLLFLLLALGFLFGGAAKAVVFPKAINWYENRSANQFPEITGEGLLSGTVQDDLEAALTDQIALAQTMEKDYYYLNTSFQLKLIDPFLRQYPDRYISLLGQKTFGGSHLVYDPISFDTIQAALDQRIDNLNQKIAAHPEVTFYVYSVENDADINFETGEVSPRSSYLASGLNLPASQVGIFSVENFSKFDQVFYLTDHHWNCYGAYQGYCQILQMIEPEEQPMEPVGEYQLSYRFSGSKASTSGAKDVFYEYFPAYQFAFPEMDITINGAPAADYGNQDAYLTGTATDSVTYARFYGDDQGELILDTHQTDRENLLVIGDSYDNAILKLLASHFNQTYSIDLRYYETAMGKSFSLSSYLEAHDITKILIIGSSSFFTSDTFVLEG